MMTRHAILCLTAVVTVLTCSPRPALGGGGKCQAIYLPRAQRPTQGNKYLQGSGVFVCHIDQKTGYVPSASVLKSTGSAVLDRAGIEFCKGFRFRPETCAREVKVPVTWRGGYAR
jgi:TonB family protein